MDTGGGGKKTAKNLKFFKDESGPSSKRWMRSDAKKISEEVGASTEMNSVSGEKKSEIDQDEKSANGGAKKPKFSAAKDQETSPKRLLQSGKKRSDKTGQSEISKENSDDVEKEAKLETGKHKKRKLVNAASDGSENPSKRRLRSDDTKDPDEAVAKKNGGQSNFILPGELLVKIIEMVPKSQWASLESVSRQFQDVVHGLWGKLDEIQLNELVYAKEKKPHQLAEAVLKKFLHRAPNVTSISGFVEFIDGGTSIRLSTIRLLSKFKHLHAIDFSGKRVVTAENFGKFLVSSATRQSWKRLDIVGGIYGELKSTNAIYSKENQPALNLEFFKFNAYNLGMLDRFLPIQWSGLKELVIVDSSDSAKEVLLIIRQCTQLAHLEISIPECGKGNGQPSYTIFMQAVADLENLSVLKMDGSWSWDDALEDALPALIQNLGRRPITDLSLVEFHCADQLLCAIINHLPQLKSLELIVGNCKTKSLERLANRMGHLECLKLESPWRSVNGTVIRAIVGNMNGLQCLHLLYQFSNSAELTTLGDLRMLKDLSVTGGYMDCGTIENWTRLGFGSCLESLQLCLRDDNSAEKMGEFLQKMPRLHSIRLRGATDDILQAIGESCPNLVELYIYCQTIITSNAIQSVINHCSQLNILNVAVHSGWFPSALTVGKYRKITFTSNNSWEY